MRYLFRWYGLTAGLVLFTSTLLAGQPFPWQPSLQNAQQQAAQTNRLILVHFWSPSCGPCRRMNAEVFSQANVAAQLNANYVPVRINVDQLPDLAHQYHVTGLPTDVVLTPQGQVIHSMRGRTDAAQFVSQLNQVAAGFRQQNGALAAQIPYRETAGGRTPPPPVPPSAVPSPRLAIPAPAYGQPAGTAAPNGTIPKQGPALNAAAPGATLGNTILPPPAVNHGFALPNTPVNSPPLLPNAPRNPPPGIPIAANAPSHLQGPTQPATPPAAAVTAAAPPQNGAPSANPPLGLDGFCPVTLAEKQKWARGDKRYGAIHRGRTYLFTGPGEQRRFFTNPDRFAPIISGNDVVLALEQGKTLSGMREHGVFFAEHVFLFADENSLRRFERNPNYYAHQAFEALRASASATPPLR